MRIQRSRRDFLQSSALGLAAAATFRTLPIWAEGPGMQGEISACVTSEKNRYASIGGLRWKKAAAAPTLETIVLDPEKQFQPILGFGAAFTDAACFMLKQLDAPARAQLFHEFFHPSEMGLSVCRTCIGASDYSTKVYSYDEGEPDPEMKRFSIAQDREYVLPMLREARKVNPEIFLFSSPWSPPGWMKSGGSMLGGAMRPRYMQAYARYFAKFLRAYADEGVPVQALTVQNEVDTDQDGRMPACIWPQEYEMKFVSEHLGPMLEKEGLATKIWILDHNFNLWGRAVAELDSPAVRKYCNAVAWHGYVGAAGMASRAHDAHPDAEMYWTEGGPDYTSPDYLTDWAKWGKTFTGALRNWCRSITAWNLALDEVGRPNIGPFPCGGVVTIQSRTHEITRSGQYWALAHFSRAVRRGARRMDSTGSADSISHVAFVNPDESKALVLTNAGPAKTVSVQAGASLAEIALEADSVTTCVWRKEA